ncbi:MAG: class I SAM-dependent methyltransferase, partial [Candidatus Diapherotrites archaeon]|nr:class I SAM-dependent methyltransferase [Candidatus Diapherotrites archaeon]
MPSRTVRKRQLARRIATAMGTSNRRPLETATRPEIQQLFHPHSEKGAVAGYPLYQISHEFSKMPQETIANFVNMPHLKRQLRQSPKIRPLLLKYPQLEHAFEQSVQNAVRERGIKASKFWESAPKGYIDQIIAGGKGRPSAMNQRMGEIANDLFRGEVKPRTILDIGTFAGGTICGTVSGLSPAQRAQLRIVLVDVNGDVVKKHAVPALEKLDVPRKNIVVLPTGFYSAAVAFGQMRRPLHERGLPRFEKQFNALIGKVDLVTAGAATLNFAVDMGPLLRSVRKLLKPGGHFVDWEWGSAEVEVPR